MNRNTEYKVGRQQRRGIVLLTHLSDGLKAVDVLEIGRYLVVAVGALFFGLMVGGTYNPWARLCPGRHLHRIRTTFRARVLIYRWYLLIILGVLIGGRSLPGQWVTDGSDLVVLVLVVSWLLFPVTYYFTDSGIALHSGKFWLWDEFDSYRSAGAAMQLRRSGAGSLSLYLTRAQQQSILPMLRRYVRPELDSNSPSTGSTSQKQQ